MLVSALGFAGAHLFRGWKAALPLLYFGIIQQCLVFVTGGLYVAMGVHTFYLIGLGWYSLSTPAAETMVQAVSSADKSAGLEGEAAG